MDGEWLAREIEEELVTLEEGEDSGLHYIRTYLVLGGAVVVLRSSWLMKAWV